MYLSTNPPNFSNVCSDASPIVRRCSVQASHPHATCIKLHSSAVKHLMVCVIVYKNNVCLESGMFRKLSQTASSEQTYENLFYPWLYS